MDAYNIATLLETRRIKAQEKLIYKTVLESDIEKLKILINPQAIALRVLIKSLAIQAYELGYKTGQDQI